MNIFERLSAAITKRHEALKKEIEEYNLMAQELEKDRIPCLMIIDGVVKKVDCKTGQPL